ncbi:MAG: ATP-binding protein [Armatimonadota bacterium]|nr:ATP-binding protein [Armatimonadota bacterium]
MPDFGSLVDKMISGQMDHEVRSVEVKSSVAWDEYKADIARAAMGMANTRDGGVILIGVVKDGQRLKLDGITADHLESYDADNVQAFVNKYADPYVRLTVDFENSTEGKDYIVIVVHPFDEMPVVCKKNYGNVLSESAIYTRSHRIPETCKVKSQTEMREILDMAVEKSVRRLVERLGRAGVRMEAAESDAKLFEQQLGGM